MPAPSLSEAIQVGVQILKTIVSTKTKKILAQTGSVVGEGQTEADNVEWWQHVGFASRPSEPEAGKEAAQAVVIRRGNFDAAIASQDLRGLSIYGNLAPGETCMYASGPDGTAQARLLLKKDGSINLFTKEGNETGGAGMGIFINPDGSVSIASHNGAAILLGDDGSVKVFNESGGIQIKADGHVKIASGSKVEISGGSITMGGPAALPLAVGPQVVAALTALQIEIAAIAATLVAVSNIPPLLPAHASAAAAATAAVGVGAAAIAAAAPLIPTKRCSGD